MGHIKSIIVKNVLRYAMKTDKNYFTTKSAILAKHEFEKFSNESGIRFEYKYHLHDAALKYIYVIQRIEKFLETSHNVNVLDMGCGSGSMLNILNKVFGLSGTGFDPILRHRRVRLNNLRVHKFSNKVKLLPLNHKEFMHNVKSDFDIVIDLCAVTHFDTRSHEKVNASWDFIGSNLKYLIKPGGIFISATDVSIYDKDSEFLFPENILNYMSSFGLIFDRNTLLTNSRLFESENIFQDEGIFQRIGKSGNNDIILGVLGFELKVAS